LKVIQGRLCSIMAIKKSKLGDNLSFL